MKEFLSRFSAAAYWSIPYAETIFGFNPAESDTIDYTVFQRSPYHG